MLLAVHCLLAKRLKATIEKVVGSENTLMQKRGMGGEDFSGQIVYYPERDEVWAYNEGHVFKVLGFEKGRVKGEWRTEGPVRLEAVDPLDFTGTKKALSGNGGSSIMNWTPIPGTV